MNRHETRVSILFDAWKFSDELLWSRVKTLYLIQAGIIAAGYTLYYDNNILLINILFPTAILIEIIYISIIDRNLYYRQYIYQKLKLHIDLLPPASDGIIFSFMMKISKWHLLDGIKKRFKIYGKAGRAFMSINIVIVIVNIFVWIMLLCSNHYVNVKESRASWKAQEYNYNIIIGDDHIQE